MENLHAKEPYQDWLRSYFVSSPLNNISSCAKISKRDLAGKRYFHQAAKDPFLKRWRQERSGKFPASVGHIMHTKAEYCKEDSFHSLSR